MAARTSPLARLDGEEHLKVVRVQARGGARVGLNRPGKAWKLALSVSGRFIGQLPVNGPMVPACARPTPHVLPRIVNSKNAYSREAR